MRFRLPELLDYLTPASATQAQVRHFELESVNVCFWLKHASAQH